MSRSGEPLSLEAAFVVLILSSFEDNLSVMRHEHAARLFARRCVSGLEEALGKVFEAGARSGDEIERALAQAEATRVFARAVQEYSESRLSVRIQNAIEEADRGAARPAEEVIAEVRARADAIGAEREASGADAFLLRRLADEYEWEADNAVDPQHAERSRARAEQLRRIAETVDLRNSA